MTDIDQRKREMRVWWWGRTLPEEYKHLTGITKIRDDELEYREKLKEIVVKAEALGINLGWGHQAKGKEIFSLEEEISYGT